MVSSAFLLLYCAFLFFVGLGDRDLLSSHEARAAQDAQTILSDGTWLLPRLFDGHIELQKPPLYYWLVAVFGKILGGEVDAWAVRLPAALSALGCVLFLFFLGAKAGRPLAGFLGAIILATCVHFTWLARIGRIDMPLTLAVTVAAGGFFLGMQAKLSAARAWPWYFVGYVCIALGILLKGPIAVALVGVAVAPFAIVRRRWQNEKDQANFGLVASLCWGVPLVLAIAAPWFFWANWETNNQVWEVFFWYHNVERGLGGSETLAAHPIWFYVPRVLFDLLPWSLALPAAVWHFFRRESWRENGLAVFGFAWFVGVFALLSCMSFKRADYLLPAYPGAALFLACVGERVWRNGLQIHNRPVMGEYPFPSPPYSGERGRGEGAEPPHASPPHPRPLSPEYAGEGRRPWLPRVFIAVLAACALCWGVYNLWIVPRQEGNWPYRELARDIRAKTNMPVIFFRAEAHVLAFHVGRPLDTILEWENLDVWASRAEPIYFIMPPDCAAVWPSHLRKGRLEEVFRTSDHAWGKRERPLVVMRSCP